MKQLIGIEYQEPSEAKLTIMAAGLRVEVEGRCVFSVIRAKEFSVHDTREEKEPKK